METKVKKEKKVRQYRSRQGRSDKQYESSMKAITYGGIACLGVFVLYSIGNAILNLFY